MLSRVLCSIAVVIITLLLLRHDVSARMIELRAIIAVSQYVLRRTFRRLNFAQRRRSKFFRAMGIGTACAVRASLMRRPPTAHARFKTWIQCSICSRRTTKNVSVEFMCTMCVKAPLCVRAFTAVAIDGKNADTCLFVEWTEGIKIWYESR